MTDSADEQRGDATHRAPSEAILALSLALACGGKVNEVASTGPGGSTPDASTRADDERTGSDGATPTPPAASDTATPEQPPPGDPIAPPSEPPPTSTCPDFTIDVDVWSISDDPDPTIETLLHVAGPAQCFVYRGNHLCNRLELIWHTGEQIPFVRETSAPDSAGYGVRECSFGTCVVGDVFQISENPEAWDAFQRLGLPDRACATVCNADGVSREQCAPF